MKKIPVGILGATGIVGRQYLALLENHPWFEVGFQASSANIDAIEQAKKSCRFVFSAITTEAAGIYEERYAQAGLPVISNTAWHRATPDVPVLIPEVNPEHAALIPRQQKKRGWERGFIVAKPNCSLQSYMIPLAPLHRKFGVESLFVTTMQAVSGAGYPGIPSLDIMDNVIPYIAGEEEKSEQEPLKIWGSLEGDAIINAENIAISAHCNRVAVQDGHMACVSVRFAKKPEREEILDLWHSFPGLQLPSAPKHPIIYRDEVDRPQPRQDRGAGDGMSVTVGRLRACPLFHFRFTALSHNTIRGAAGGGILNAELLVQGEYICGNL